MKKKIFLTLVFCAFSTAFITGCINSSDIAENTPTESEEEAESKVSALAVSFNGQNIGYVHTDTTPNELKEVICELKFNELSESGSDVKAVKLGAELVLTASEVAEKEILSEAELASKLYDLSPIFEITLIEREEKTLDFNTVYQNSASHYEGTKVTKTEGQNGSSKLIYEAVYLGEEQLSRTLVEERVIKASQDKVVLVGTKKSTASTGVYGSPLKTLYVTSSYGARTLNGKYDFHYGVDFRAATGTSVYASDGGKVIYAGTMGSYGKLVKIEHDNGDVTYYAHLSSISVKVGERVYKGQTIAKSGATGNVTGPHLHFEIRINGKHKDPMKYL